MGGDLLRMSAALSAAWDGFPRVRASCATVPLVVKVDGPEAGWVRHFRFGPGVRLVGWDGPRDVPRVRVKARRWSESWVLGPEVTGLDGRGA